MKWFQRFMGAIKHRRAPISTAVEPAARAGRFSIQPRTVILGSLIGLLAYLSVQMFLQTALLQPMGMDFSCFWAGGRVALRDPARLYDFSYVTNQQAWLIGHRHMRPFIYPPSSLEFFLPFATLRYWPAYGLWDLITGGLFLAAALRSGARWWVLTFPPIAYVAVCGQITFLTGALITAALTFRSRPLLAGLLFGCAGAIKPQILVLLPVALLADRQWRTIWSTALSAGILAVVSASIWGIGLWQDWLRAVPRFQHAAFAIPSLVRTMLTPYATLAQMGASGAWAYLLVPPVLTCVWLVFRRTQAVPERSLALIGGALLIIPYAMNYEMALLVPAAAALLARTNDRRWPAYAIAAPVIGVGFVYCLPALGLFLAIVGWGLWPSLSRAPSPAAPTPIR